MKTQFVFPIIKRLCSIKGIDFIEEPTRQNYALLTFKAGNKFYIKDANFNINSVSSMRVCKNKALTSFFLEHLGYSTPLFTIVSSALSNCCNAANSLSRGIQFANNVGYPVILKPNSESKGEGVHKIFNECDLEKVGSHLLNIFNEIQIQKYYHYNEYRIVVLGDSIISAYQKIPLEIQGDGKRSILELLKNRQQLFVKKGRDTIINYRDSDIKAQLKKNSYTLDTVLKEGVICQLRSTNNLSTGGEAIDVIDSMHQEYKNLCLNISKDLALELSGIDILCSDIKSPIGAYVILEVNSAPGLDNYLFPNALQQKYLESLYDKILDYINEKLSR